jgi:SpoVK/Ycf46/Vps4 family AAA+-type ATPase
MSRRDEEVDMEELLASPLKWRHNEGMFHVTMDAKTIKRLPAGCYETEMGMAGPFVNVVDLKQEELIPFKSGPCNQIVEEVDKFWRLEKRYAKLGLPYRRGVLMYGPPGTGKSGIVRLVGQKLIEQDGLVMIVKCASTFTSFIPLLNKLEPERKLVIVLEDLERLLLRQEQTYLQLLDGIASDRPGMLFLATTNHLDELEPRVYRPSRFDLLIEVGMPNKATREVYVRRLCEKFGTKYNSKFVTLTDGLSFAALKEIIISCLVLDKKIEDMVKRMKSYRALVQEMGDDDDDND